MLDFLHFAAASFLRCPFLPEVHHPGPAGSPRRPHSGQRDGALTELNPPKAGRPAHIPGGKTHSMPKPSATTQMERNVDRLVRSLVGVMDYAAHWEAPGRIHRLDILRDPAVEEHQLIRNVVSGLGAGCGLRIPRSDIHIHPDAAAFRAATAVLAEMARGRASATGDDTAGESGPATSAPPVAGAEPAAADGLSPATRSGTGASRPANGAAHVGQNGSVHTGQNGSAHDGAHNGVEQPAPGEPAGPVGRRITPPAADLRAGRPTPADSGRVVPMPGPQATASADASGRRRRQPAAGPQRRTRDDDAPDSHATVLQAPSPAAGGELRLDQLDLENRGATLRCRAVLVLGDNIYSAIAEVPPGPTAETDVAARVTLDALRAGALVCATLDGVGFCTIGGRTWVVAAVRDSGNVQARAGVVPLRGSMGRAAAEAVLAALGPVTSAHQDAAALRLGGM